MFSLLPYPDKITSSEGYVINPQDDHYSILPEKTESSTYFDTIKDLSISRPFFPRDFHMSHKTSLIAVAALAIVSLCATVGCETVYGPNLGLMGYPIPVTPFLQDHLEDKAYEHERYERVPIMGPITSGTHMALDPPSEDQIMRALEKARPLEGGTPFAHTTHAPGLSHDRAGPASSCPL